MQEALCSHAKGCPGMHCRGNAGLANQAFGDQLVDGNPPRRRAHVLGAPGGQRHPARGLELQTSVGVAAAVDLALVAVADPERGCTGAPMSRARRPAEPGRSNPAAWGRTPPGRATESSAQCPHTGRRRCPGGGEGRRLFLGRRTAAGGRIAGWPPARPGKARPRAPLELPGRPGHRGDVIGEG